jgi:RimK family alpha-L-glutamate ligase
MKKRVIGYIFYGKNLEKDERLFLKLARKKNVELVLFNLAKDIDDDRIEEDIKRCDIIFNNSAEEFAIELVKTAEELGKKVVDSSKAYYCAEDKWMIFLKCKEHGIPTPETDLLSENINFIARDLKKFSHWPVVLKRVEGTCGEYVSKADNPREAIKIVKKFWKKGSQKLPIIAQELIRSPSYRVLVIDGKIVQTALKENHGWKATGIYAKKIKKFPVNKELKRIVKNVVKVSGIKVCGVDLLKKDGKWFVLEVNSEPAFDFFEDEREMVIGKVLDLLKKEARH